MGEGALCEFPPVGFQSARRSSRLLPVVKGGIPKKMHLLSDCCKEFINFLALRSSFPYNRSLDSGSPVAADGFKFHQLHDTVFALLLDFDFMGDMKR